MKSMYFAQRNLKEMLRDPLTLAFGVGFPVVLLGLLTIIQNNIPVSMFELDHLTPGIAVFGLSFVSLFSGLPAREGQVDLVFDAAVFLSAHCGRLHNGLLPSAYPAFPVTGRDLLCVRADIGHGL